MTIQMPDPGIYPDLTFEEYLAWPCVNNSSLAAAKRSMAHYRACLDEPRNEPTDALRFGKFAHAGKLEPLMVAARYVVMPAFEDEIRKSDGSEYSNPKAARAYKDLVAEFSRINAGKEIVAQGWFDRLMGMLTALSENSRARDWLGGEGDAEVSIVWDDPVTGVRCKGRLDKWQFDQARITDLKTTLDASDFPRSLHRYGYARQAAFYADGMQALTGEPHQFCIVAVEKESPFGVRAAAMGEDSMMAGRSEYRQLLSQIADCRQSGQWPSYEDPDVWELPAWAIPEVSLTVGGQVVSL